VSEGTENTVRLVTRLAALAAPAAGALLLYDELRGTSPRVFMLIIGGALIVCGPLFWFLARAPATVIGAVAAFILGVALAGIGAVRDGSDAGFDLGLGIGLAGVAVWMLVAHYRGNAAG